MDEAADDSPVEEETLVVVKPAIVVMAALVGVNLARVAQRRGGHVGEAAEASIRKWGP